MATLNNPSPKNAAISTTGKIVRKQYKYLYDFSTQGGSYTVASGVITLTDPDGNALLMDPGDIVDGAVVELLAACTSGGSATVSVDLGGTAAGILAATAVASLTLEAVFKGLNASALTTGAKLVTSTASTQKVQITIGTADLTAGKILVTVFAIPGGLTG